MIINEKNIHTAGGKIVCNRCQAKSKRTQQQCGRPAMRGKNVCNFHGGKSSGPKTTEGKERSRQAHIKTGGFTSESRQRQLATMLQLAYIEDMMYEINITSAPKTRGPKPAGYIKYNSVGEIIQAIKETSKNTGLGAKTTK